uniref:Regulator of microtubule dynamics protein 1 n=1 Tax=Mola mola TaxID=94237 RepID=A0A3Q4ARA1_MOLML
MAGRVVSRCVSRTLLSARPANGVMSGGVSRCFSTSVRRTAAALTGGGGAFLLGLPALSYLGYEAYHRVQSSAVVLALEKEEVLEQADYLYSCAESEKLHQLLLQYKDSDDAEFLWRLARAARDLALEPNMEAGTKKQLMYEAFENAKKALERDEESFAVHKWYAICLSDVGDYEGVKVKIGNAYIIRDHLERAIMLNPKDATSLYIMGYWCFAFAELPWYQRKVAAIIFSTPPTSTYDEALGFFLKAEEVDPNFYSKNLLLLGKTYLAMNDKEKALLWLNKAKEYPARTLEDKEVEKEAVHLLKKLG